MKHLLFFLLIISLISCNNSVKYNSTINGKTNDTYEGKSIILEDAFTNESIDTAIVTNYTFSFYINVDDHPRLIRVKSEDPKDRKSIWIEKGETQITVLEGNLKKAKISGSETQHLYEDHSNSKSGTYKERLAMDEKFVRNTPNSILSAFNLYVYSTTWGKNKTEELYTLLAEDIKASKYGQKVRRFLELSQEPKVGDQFVDLNLPNAQGDSLKLSDYKGKVILLEFWASWCGACRAEFPALRKTYEKYKEDGFEIYAVSIDHKRDQWNKALEEDKPIWVNVSDLKGVDSDAKLIYGVNYVPYNFLIDQQGEIVARNIHDLTLTSKLDELLGK